MSENNVNAFLLFTCPDKNGIVAKITQFIYEIGGNIIDLDEHVNQNQQFFSLRIAWNMSNSTIPASKLHEAFEPLAKEFDAHWRIEFSNQKQRVAIFVSKYDHCLYDILGRYNSGELFLEIPFILSNHLDLKPIADSFKIPFYHIPVTKDTKKEAEQQQLELLTSYNIDFIVLARYMQIVSETLIDKYPNKIINIHHSFLPAFVGAKPYHSAYKRGVKIIGATSHYVTEELDAGPIIEQDVARVSHTHSIDDLISKGRDLEKIVLANAIKLHTNRKVMVYNNKTLIFS